MTDYATSVDEIFRAYQRVAKHVHRTPLLSNQSLSEQSGLELRFKCELFQRTGSFKIRGALNAILKLDAEVAKRGVVTHSSGNHGQAVALAAAMRDIEAHVVVPSNTSATKRQAVAGYGAQLYECEASQQAREHEAQRLVTALNATLIPPFDHPDVIAGQGTIALELLEQVDELDAVVVPVGGGGMVSGISLALASLAPSVRVIAAEPAEADDTFRSMLHGSRALLSEGYTIADGLRTRVGELTWPIIRDHVERVIRVDEASIAQAMRHTWERTKLLIEPSAAVGIAALHTEEMRALELDAVAVILCGGNVDLSNLPW